MKIGTILLAVSLAANVGLAALLLVHRAETAPTFSSVIDGKSPQSIAASANRQGTAVAKGGPAASTPQTLWARLHPNDDLAAVVHRLREAGFPPLVLRRVVQALVKEQFDAHRLEIEKDSLKAPYWNKPTNDFFDPKIGPELRKLQTDQTALLMKLLGGNAEELFADTEDGKAMLRIQVGDIPMDKLYQLYQVWIGFANKRADIYAAGANSGAMLPADRAKAMGMESQLRDALGQFLSPGEVTDFMMRNGIAGGTLRNLLMPFQPTEAEFRSIYPAYQAYLEQFPANPMFGQTNTLTPDQTAARDAALDTLKSQISAAIGDQRAADFNQVMNPQDYQLNRLVSRLDLPLSAATQVGGIQKDIQQRAEAIRTDTTLTRANQTAQLTALAQEASSQISNVLGGQRGLDAYKQYGGQWLVTMVPRRPPGH
ncbi:MAG TPA: hypothetical protein VHE61_19150 [Opitutaceae bacterium]|nr:hypothetical protein [Opitutaceae bacterium]